MASAAIIIFLTAYNEDAEGVAATYLSGIPLLSSLSVYMVPASVTLINTAMPVFLKKINAFELWDSEKFAVLFLMFRLFVSKIINAALQVSVLTPGIGSWAR